MLTDGQTPPLLSACRSNIGAPTKPHPSRKGPTKTRLCCLIYLVYFWKRLRVLPPRYCSVPVGERPPPEPVCTDICEHRDSDCVQSCSAGHRLRQHSWIHISIAPPSDIHQVRGQTLLGPAVLDAGLIQAHLWVSCRFGNTCWLVMFEVFLFWGQKGFIETAPWEADNQHITWRQIWTQGSAVAGWHMGRLLTLLSALIRLFKQHTYFVCVLVFVTYTCSFSLVGMLTLSVLAPLSSSVMWFLVWGVMLFFLRDS